MDFKITDAYFEDLKRRRRRRDIRMGDKRGGKTATSPGKRQRPQANKSQRKTA